MRPVICQAPSTDLVHSMCQEPAVPVGIKEHLEVFPLTSPLVKLLEDVTQEPTLDGTPDGHQVEGAARHLPPASVWAKNGTVSRAPCPCPATSRIWYPTFNSQWDATYSGPAPAPTKNKGLPSRWPMSGPPPSPATVPQAGWVTQPPCSLPSQLPGCFCLACELPCQRSSLHGK